MSEQPDDRFLHALREEPRPEFAAQLAARLGVSPAIPDRQRSMVTRGRPWRRLAMCAVAAALLLLAGLGTFRSLDRPRPQGAQDVLQRVAGVSVNDLGVRTYHLRVETDTYMSSQFNRGTPVPGSLSHSTTVSERWGAQPDRWRIDFRFATQPFIAGTDRVSGSVSDGATEWSYNPREDLGYDVQIGALPAGSATPPLDSIPLPTGDLQPGQAVGIQGGGQPGAPSRLECYHDATITGAAMIAGRDAYVIDLGTNTCSPGYKLGPDGTRSPLPTVAPEQQGRQTMWVDKALYVPLKLETDDPDGSPRVRTEVTVFEVNQPIPDAIFTFNPPTEVTDVQVVDLRPQPYQLPDSAIPCRDCGAPGLTYPRPTPSPTPVPTRSP